MRRFPGGVSLYYQNIIIWQQIKFAVWRKGEFGTSRRIGRVSRPCPIESAAMKHVHDCNYVYVVPFRPAFILLIVSGAAVVITFLVNDWLNGLPIQIVGPVLYPVERILNAVFFPEAQTPLRPNGSALLVLVPTAALFAAIYFAARAVLGGIMRVLRLFAGGC